MNNPALKEKHSSGVRQSVLLGLFSGTAIGAGFLLAGVPNVELMTLIVALAGSVLGPWLGALCGVISIGTYSLGSPFGLPVPVLLAGQVLGFSFTGILGGLVASKIKSMSGEGRRLRSMLLAAATGLLATFLYDLLTSVASIQAFGMDPAVTFAGAVPFVLVHLAVNGIIFSLLFPTLVNRLAGLAKPVLQGQGRIAGTAILTLLALGVGSTSWAQSPEPELTGPVAADSDSVFLAQATPVAKGPHGWRRPLWQPYAPQMVQWLNWNSPWVTVQDGGLGAATMILGEASTNSLPTVRRDGVPLGCGHVLVDDPWLVSNQGLQVSQQNLGPDPRTGNDGQIDLQTLDLAPDRAMSLYRGLKGPHESYHRGFSLLTPKVAWRLAFEFDESLDNEAYNFSEEPDEIFRGEVPFPGHAKIRSSRTRLIRQLNPESSLALEYSTGRKTKDSLPALGAEHQEIWSTGAAATMHSRAGNWLWRSVLYWNSRDVRWGDRPNPTASDQGGRLLEVVREGVEIDVLANPVAADSTGLGAGPTSWDQPQRSTRPALGLRYSRWEVLDEGDSAFVLPAPMQINGQGETAQLSAGSGIELGSFICFGTATGSWDNHGGGSLGGEIGLARGGAGHNLSLVLQRSGRPPRSDELFTPWQHDVNGRSLTILPNIDLEREKTWRLQALAQGSLLGFDLAVEGSNRQLKNGITWVALDEDPDTGQLGNSLEMNSSRLTGSIGRQGRFLGWARVRLEGTWQTFEEKAGQASFLPPENHIRLVTMWENHLFQEDGILQLALYSTRRQAMDDPWDMTRQTQLPQLTWHDLVLGFRLRGAHLSLAIRNLNDQKVKLSAGSYSNGREMDLRLHWAFPY